ncbi:hypothetical protein C8Q76DRAFT_798464 [Earliella scabrosa]|nr:hypothetical protein C8Q76DRAFT_798464 [Earliella scabrosa]
MSQTFQVSRMTYLELHAISGAIATTEYRLNDTLYRRLGLRADDDVTVWQELFLTQLREDKMLYRNNALEKLRVDASFMRSTSVIQVMEDALCGIADARIQLREQLHKSYGLETMSINEEDQFRHALEAMEAREMLLREHFNLVLPSLLVLQLPEDTFERLVSSLEQPVDSDDATYGTMNNLIEEIETLRQERRSVRELVAFIMTNLREDPAADATSSALVHEMRKYHDRLLSQVDVQRELIVALVSIPLIPAEFFSSPSIALSGAMESSTPSLRPPVVGPQAGEYAGQDMDRTERMSTSSAGSITASESDSTTASICTHCRGIDLGMRALESGIAELREEVKQLRTSYEHRPSTPSDPAPVHPADIVISANGRLITIHVQ